MDSELQTTPRSVALVAAEHLVQTTPHPSLPFLLSRFFCQLYIYKRIVLLQFYVFSSQQKTSHPQGKLAVLSLNYKILAYCSFPQSSKVTPIILGRITDVTAHSVHMKTNTEQQDITTKSKKLLLYSASQFFPLPKSLKIIYSDIRNAGGILIIIKTVET